jgi:hypothetical protein
VLEVKGLEGAEVLLFEVMCCCELGLVDFGIEGIDVGRMFLQGDGVAGDEVCQQHYGCMWWLEVSGLGYVKWKYGVSSCDGEVW